MSHYSVWKLLKVDCNSQGLIICIIYTHPAAYILFLSNAKQKQHYDKKYKLVQFMHLFSHYCHTHWLCLTSWSPVIHSHCALVRAPSKFMPLRVCSAATEGWSAFQEREETGTRALWWCNWQQMRRKMEIKEKEFKIICVRAWIMGFSRGQRDRVLTFVSVTHCCSTVFVWQGCKAMKGWQAWLETLYCAGIL